MVSSFIGAPKKSASISRRQYCLETGFVQEFATINTLQQIRVSKNVGRTLCAMVQCILADSDFPSSMWRKLFMADAYLKNRTPHKALKIETSFKILDGEGADLSHLCAIGARPFVHIKDSRKLEAAAWEGKVCDYSEESKFYRVWIPKTCHVVGNRNVTFIRDTAAPASPAFKAPSVARSGIAIGGSRRRHSGQRLHFIRRLITGCKGIYRCSGLHHQHSLSPREHEWHSGQPASVGVSRPNQQSRQERLAHVRCTFAWSRIANVTVGWSSSPCRLQ